MFAIISSYSYSGRCDKGLFLLTQAIKML